ncbi:MAG: hypothetical protein PHF25_09260 [Candidatus Margulisbacteria bacterium]|nr:hypothetical protein [Candidatus Margulisiibacteriota bacterium]
MDNFKTLAKKALTNTAILYIISRYATYIIQFINSLFIALYLGPYYLGVWGFIILILGYCGKFDLGIAHSANAILSINKNNDDYVEKVIGNSLSMIMGLSIVILLVLYSFKYINCFNIGEKYNFDEYIIIVSIIAVLTYFNALFSNIFRIYGKILLIALNQSLYPIIVLLIMPFFRSEILIWAMLIAYSFSTTISFILFLYQRPVPFKLRFSFDLVKHIQIKGWHLFVYNTSLHLIILSTNSFISSYYAIDEFGYYTFSYSFANAIFLLLSSISYLIFPKMLNRFASSNNTQINNILGNIRVAYISLSHLIVHFLIIIFPFFLFFFPEYQQASPIFKITALTLVLYTNSYGYSGLLIARGKERSLGLLTFLTLLFNIGLTYLFIVTFKFSISLAILGSMITYFFYTLYTSMNGRKNMGLNSGLISTFIDVYPWRMMLPFLISLILIITNSRDVFFIIPFTLYFFLNFNDIKIIRNLVLKVIKDPNLMNI